MLYYTGTGVPVPTGLQCIRTDDRTVIHGLAHLNPESCVKIETLNKSFMIMEDMPGAAMPSKLKEGHGMKPHLLLFNFLRTLPAVVAAGLLMISTAQAGITTSGGISPSNLADWNASTDAYIGWYGSGSLSITGDDSLAACNLNVGYDSEGTVTVDGAGSILSVSEYLEVIKGTLSITGGASLESQYASIRKATSSYAATVTVSGTGSSWTNTSYLTIDGGILNIWDNATVEVSGSTTVYEDGSINFGDSEGGTLTTGTLYAGASQLSGSGTINAAGILTDAALVFDRDHGTTQTFTIGDVTINLSLVDSGDSVELGDLVNSIALGVGYLGDGSLTISEGVAVTSDYGYLGYGEGANGVAVITGEGSSWTVGYELTVGSNGTGSLTVQNGGSLTSGYAYVDWSADDQVSSVTVTGDNSSWVSDYIYLGNEGGTGTLDIRDSGSVTTDYMYVGNGSTGILTVDDATLESFYLAAGFNDGTGTLTIQNGGYVSSMYVSIGDEYEEYENTSGAVTVKDAGSKLKATNLDVGNYGTLNILSGAEVSVSEETMVSEKGNINFGDSGGTLTTGTLYAGTSQLSGTGTINTSGIVSDIDLTFDSTHGTTQSFKSDDVTINLTQDASGDLGAGYLGNATLTIDGLDIVSDNGYLGYFSGSSGTADVDGEDSSWTTNYLYVGYEGEGVLNILNGAMVTVSKETVLGDQGSINFGENGGTLTTGTLYAATSQLSGTGTINTSGIISDIDLVFDSSYDGITQSFTSDGITINLSLDDSSILGVGYKGEGSLTVTGGVSVASDDVYLGYSSGSKGMASVNGAGSILVNSDYFFVGYAGEGSLSITNGGSVVSGLSQYDISAIGYQYGSKGAATVNGAGSTWVNSGYLNLYSGTLSISDGGQVSANRVYIYSGSTATVDVNSSLKAGTADNDWSGTLYNRGTIRLVAGAGAAASDTYTPLSYGTLSNYGSFEVLGGVWDAGTKTVKVSDAVAAGNGEEASVTLSESQRVLVTDTSTGKSAGAAFLAADTTISLTATLLGEADLDSLETLVAETDEAATVLSAWQFSLGEGDDYDDAVYLSLFAEGATDVLDLIIWYLSDEDGWVEYDAADLAFDNTYASFAVTELGTYAVSAVTSAVPVPGAVFLLGSGILALAGLKRRKNRHENC